MMIASCRIPALRFLKDAKICAQSHDVYAIFEIPVFLVTMHRAGNIKMLIVGYFIFFNFLSIPSIRQNAHGVPCVLDFLLITLDENVVLLTQCCLQKHRKFQKGFYTRKARRSIAGKTLGEKVLAQ